MAEIVAPRRITGRVECDPPDSFQHLRRLLMSNGGISTDEMVVCVLRAPPEAGFDCGREEQTRFLYEWAWTDQQAQISVTYGYYLRGILVAYATVCMDTIPLGKKERESDVRYVEVGAVKLAQLGVAVSCQRRGIGRMVVADVISLARTEAMQIGCRYVTLDAQPELEPWYESQGFRRNHLRQAKRVLDALTQGREPERIAVSMRLNCANCRIVIRDPCRRDPCR